MVAAVVIVAPARILQALTRLRFFADQVGPVLVGRVMLKQQHLAARRKRVNNAEEGRFEARQRKQADAPGQPFGRFVIG